MQETRALSLGGEDDLEEEMAPHSSILALRIACPKVRAVPPLSNEGLSQQRDGAPLPDSGLFEGRQCTAPVSLGISQRRRLYLS